MRRKKVKKEKRETGEKVDWNDAVMNRSDILSIDDNKIIRELTEENQFLVDKVSKKEILKDDRVIVNELMNQSDEKDCKLSRENSESPKMKEKESRTAKSKTPSPHEDVIVKTTRPSKKFIDKFPKKGEVQRSEERHKTVGGAQNEPGSKLSNFKEMMSNYKEECLQDFKKEYHKK